MAVKFTKTNLLRSPQPEVKPKAEAKAKTETKGAPTIDGGIATPNTIVTDATAPGTPDAPTSNPKLPDSLQIVPTPVFGAGSTPVTATGVAPDVLKDLKKEMNKKILDCRTKFAKISDSGKMEFNPNFDEEKFNSIVRDMQKKFKSLEAKMTELNTKLIDVNNLVKSYNSEKPKSEETYNNYLKALDEYNSCLQTFNEEYESLQKLINDLPFSVLKVGDEKFNFKKK